MKKSRMVKKRTILITAIAVVSLMTGCGSNTNDKKSVESTTKNTVENTISDNDNENENTTKEEKSPDFNSIDGYWYIDGKIDTAYIHISNDGRYTAYYADGNEENSGYIKYEKEDASNTVNYWYNLYSDSGDFYMGFIDDGSSEKTDLYVGNGGFPHYVLMYGEGGLGDDGRGDDELSLGEEYVGVWGCGRATLKIEYEEETGFRATIFWADSAAAHVEWVYPLIFDEENNIMSCQGNASKSYVVYTDNNTNPDITIEYTDGSGNFVLEDDAIIWNDETENMGKDMRFINNIQQ